MASINMQTVLSDLKSGMSVTQLAKKYKLSEKQLNELIQKELTYTAPDAYSKYQQVKAEHNEKVEKEYNLAYEKLKSGEYMEALKLGLNATIMAFNAPDNPYVNYGIAPCPMKWADAKSIVSLIKSLKNLPKAISNLKNCKSVEQFKSFILNIAKKLGINKLNPKSFVGKTSNKKPPYAGSSKAAELTTRYNESGVLYYDKKIADGFRDGGHNAQYNRWGDAVYAEREVITVDRLADKYLSNAIEYAKNNTRNMNEEQKLKFIYKMIQEISGNAEKGLKKSEEIAKQYKGCEVLLGDSFANGAACCRHKALMFKILSEEVGLNAKMVRGVQADAFGKGGHVWNEIKLSNGKKFIVDTQNKHLINLERPSKSDQNTLKTYYYNNQHVY